MVKLAILVAALLALLPRMTHGERPMVTRQGRRTGTLVAIKSDLQMRFREGDLEFEVPGHELAWWGGYTGTDRGAYLLLTDGSELVGDLEAVTDETIRFKTRGWGVVTLPRSLVRGIVVTPVAGLARQDQLWLELNAVSEQDELLFKNGDRLQGELSARRGEDPAGMEFQLKAGSLAAAQTFEGGSVSAVHLRSRGQSVSRRPRLEMGFRGGSLLMVERVEPQGRGQVDLKLTCGASLRSPVERIADMAVWIQPMRFGGYQYLGELAVLGYRQIPFLEVRRSWGRDRNALEGRLRAGGQVFPRGIGMVPASRLAFELTGAEESFEAELAIDQRAGQGGSVVYRVFVSSDESDPWQPVYESPIVRGGQPPLPIAVQLRSASRLALLVDFAERGDERDYANWINARFRLRNPED